MTDAARLLFIGGYTPDKGHGTGIAVVHGGQSKVDHVIAAESPSFVIWHPSRPVMYAIAESPRGQVVAWSVDGGSARRLGAGETGGADPCHLTVDATGRFLVTVNYTSGSVAVHRLDEDGGIGARTDLVEHQRHGPLPRQDRAHTHMVRVVGDGLVVIDLGGDALYRYHLDDGRLIRDAVIDAPAGSGPRHMIQAGGRWLVTAELAAAVLVYADDWTPLGQVPSTRSDTECLTSELVARDGFLYVANRGPDTIAMFRLGDGLPEYVTEVPTGRGSHDIVLAGDRLYVANERSDEVVTMRFDPATGIPAPVGRIVTPSPTCVLVR
jgi:6-phosphogluconolactonase